MNILLVTDAYPPEIRSASHLMQELAEELRNRGHLVTVATCYPRYNLATGKSDQNFEQCSYEKGIRVIRIRTLPHHKVNFLIRGIAQLLLPYIFWGKLKGYLSGGVEGAVVYTPPLPLWQVGRRAKNTYGAKFILNVQDIFPQNAIDLGILKNPFLIRLFKRMEQRAYKEANTITVHSVGNCEFLTEKQGLSPKKVVTLHNWVNLDVHKRAVDIGRFRKKYGLENKFIFFFGGVMGPSQGLDLIIDAARELRGIDDLAILLVGDGTEKEKLQRMVHDYSLRNVVFDTFVSKEEYQLLLKEVNVGMVCLSMRNKTPVVPGKILDYMAASLPVLALLNEESDGHHIIREAGCGYSEASEDVSKAASLMLRMYRERERLKEYGKSGFGYAGVHFSKKICVDRLEELLE
jgi:colanic acid biosynthesis glycosyl transferase WcaI